jgi:hypothetical protein
VRLYFDKRGRYAGSSMSLMTYLVLIVLLIAAAIAYWPITLTIIVLWLLAVWARHREWPRR